MFTKWGTAREQLRWHLLTQMPWGRAQTPPLSLVWNAPSSAQGCGSKTPPCPFWALQSHRAGPSILGNRVLTCSVGQVHLLQAPKLGGGQSDICREHKGPHPSLRVLWPCLPSLPTPVSGSSEGYFKGV